jgi:co-chaperonin GroES (HSP10)
MIVKVLKSEEYSIDSIVVPKTANSSLTEGLVLKVDPVIEKMVAVGNIVIFPTGAGVGQYIGNDACLWLTVNEIWATFEMDKEDE